MGIGPADREEFRPVFQFDKTTPGQWTADFGDATDIDNSPPMNAPELFWIKFLGQFHDALLNKAAEILNCKIADLEACPRIAASDKGKMDMLIYLLWETGKYTNIRIGSLFGLTYSSSHMKWY